MGLIKKIIFGTPKEIVSHDYGKNVFVSRPYYKIVFDNGLGFYILNSYKFRLLPRFYGMIHSTFWELGFDLCGWTFEIMWNKYFKI